MTAGVLAVAELPAAAATGPGWSRSRPLSSNVRHGLGYGDKQIVVDSRGDSALVWQDPPGNKQHLHAVTRDAGQSWSAPHLFTFKGTPGEAQFSSIGIGGRGRTVVVWTDIGRNKLLWAQHRPGGSWTPARPVPNQPVAYGNFSMSTTGWGVLAYVHDGAVYVRKLTPDSVWKAPVKVSATKPPKGDLLAHPYAAIGTDNSVVAVWDTEHPDNASQLDFFYAHRGGLTSAGARRPVVNIWPGDNDQNGLVFSHSASGNAVAVFVSDNRFVVRLADGRWHHHAVPTPAGATNSVFSDFALIDSSASVYWWTENSDRSQSLYVSDLTGGAWSAPQVVQHFPKGQLFYSAEAARSSTQRIVLWTSEATAHDASSYSVHVRTTVGGQTYNTTLAPRSYDLAAAATGDHAAVAFGRAKDAADNTETLYALTR